MRRIVDALNGTVGAPSDIGERDRFMAGLTRFYDA
jgi:hypothetical protein